MKATIKYRDVYSGKLRQKTIEVDKNEPNYIVREFCKNTRLPWWTYIFNVKCGRYEYQWRGIAEDAGVPRGV